MPAPSPYPSIAKAFEQITVDGIRLTPAGLLQWLDLRARMNDAEWVQDLRTTMAELIHLGNLPAMSSGTTGPPKRFTISKRDLVMSARLTGATFGLMPGDRVLHCLPARYIAGKLMLLRGFALGLDVHFINPRGSVLQNLIADERFRFAAMVPLQLHRAIQDDRSRVERQFEKILLGGGPVSAPLTEELRTLNAQVFQSFGSTETVTHVAIRRINGEAPEDHFTAIGECHFARDPRGCLVVHTPHLTVQQHVTNDLVELKSDTTFRWLGRIDNVILSGGKKIFPEQLESRTAGLLPYPHFFSATPDDVLGQAVMLTIESTRPQAEVMPQVMELLMPHLHPHEWPRRVIVLPRFARTASGKVIRN